MKNSFRTLMVWILLVGSAVGLCVAGTGVPGNDRQTEARGLVQRYLQALQRGDTQEIAALLGGRALEEAAEALANPRYGNLLAHRYEGAHLEISGYGITRTGDVTVDILIRLADQGLINERLTVAADRSGGEGLLRIVDRVPLEGDGN